MRSPWSLRYGCASVFFARYGPWLLRLCIAPSLISSVRSVRLMLTGLPTSVDTFRFLQLYHYFR